jgi:BirA family transcriptional regulator, biotin operon repressor / biotin---[acetyl-CoA-carboxylase] ligase
VTPLAFAVLRRLADAEFRSGSVLARDFGVSRGTIWNAVCSIEAAGLTVFRVRGRGYRLAHTVSLLERDMIVRHAGTCAARLTIELADRVDSTNTLLMQRAAAGAPCGTVLAAELQERVRGRMGRAWHAGLGESLTFSLLWRFTQGAAALAGLSLAAGVAIVRALEKIGAHDIALKWPNDVLWRGHKLAGLLIEMQGDALGPSAVVIGVGLNVSLSEAVRARIDQPAAALERACGEVPDRNRVLGALLAELTDVLDTFARQGLAPLRAEWERHHAYQDKPVTVTLPDGRREEGIACGVGDDGVLQFETPRGLRRLHSGEISVRSDASEGGGRVARRAPPLTRTRS